MANHIFRYVLLMALGIIPLYFMEIENKFAIMIGWIIGGTLAFIIGNIILQKLRSKQNFNQKKE